MAFKTGKSFTLSLAGTTTGNFNSWWAGSPFGGQAQCQEKDISWSLNLAGIISCSGSYQFITVSAGDPLFGAYPWGSGKFPAKLVASVTAGSGSSSSTTGEFPAGFPPGGNYGPYSNVGSFSMSFPVDEWADIVYDDPTVDSDTGVYLPIPTCRVNVYLALTVGGTISASASFGGLNASSTSIIGSATVITPSISASATWGPNSGVSPYGGGGSGSLGVAWVITGLPTSLPGDTATETSAGSSASASVSSTSISLSVSAPGPPSGGFAQHGAASASLTAYPAKSYSMAGEIFSVDSAYPGTIPINFSRYAGDPTPTLTGAGFSAGYSQQRYSYTATSAAVTAPTTIGGGPTTGGQQIKTANVNQFQGLSASTSSSWCDANDEFITYTNVHGAQVKLYNNLIYLMGWSTGGIGLSLTSPFNVDPGNSLTGWTGATLGGAGIGNTGTGAMTRTFTPFFDMSGHRYLRITGAVTTSGTPQNRVVTIGGKTWNVTFPTVAANIFLDLCNPTTGGADTDTTDTIWTDPNPTLVYGADSGTSVSAGPGDGPLWGVTYCTSLALTGFAGGSTESFASLDMVMKTEATGHFLCQWEPRFDELIIQGPDWSVPAGGGGDTVFTRGVLRGFILTTDGRQSAEYRSYSLLRTEGGGSGITTYGVTNYSISAMAFSVNNGIQIDGGPVGSDANYFNYAVKSNGWVATVSAAAPDGTNNLNAGFLNSNLPASWVCYGVKYAAAGFTSSVGVDLTSGGGQGAQVLMSALDFYPGCGDVFGLGGGSPSANTVYFGASKIYRAQSHGIIMTRGASVFPPAPGSNATLFPGPGEVQPTGAAVGNATSDSPQSVYRTVGDGLDGFNAVTVGPTTTVSDNIGIVTARTGAGAPQSVSITVGEAKLSRAAFRLPTASATIIRPDNFCGLDGSYHRVAGLYDMSGSPAGIAYWRCDFGAPRTASDWTIAAIPIDTNTDDLNPSIIMDVHGRAWCLWERLAGIYQAFSDDYGASWSAGVLTIPNGLYPVIEVGHDGSIYRAAYVDDGTGMSTGTIKALWQYPGDTSPRAPVTFKKWNGAAYVDIAVQLGSFGLTQLRENAGRWILTVVEVGATTAAEYVSGDDYGSTFIATGT